MLDRLKQIFDDEDILYKKEDLINYNYDASQYSGEATHVVRPKTLSQIQDLINLAKRYNFSIMVRGSGTSLTGASTPNTCIVLDLFHFNKIKIVNTKELWLEVEPNVTIDEINKILKTKDLFFPIIPSSHSCATIGGMVATNGGGSYSYKLGFMKEWVLGLEYIDGIGNVFYIGENSRFKDIIGSEGTLAIITRIRLKIIPVFKKTAMFFAKYDSIKSMLSKVEELEQSEYKKDILAIEFISKSAQLNDQKNKLFVEFNIEKYIEENKEELAENNPEKIDNKIETETINKINESRITEEPKKLQSSYENIDENKLKSDLNKINEDIQDEDLNPMLKKTKKESISILNKVTNTIKSLFVKQTNKISDENNMKFPWNHTSEEEIKKLKTEREEYGTLLAQRKYLFMEDPQIPKEHIFDFIQYCEKNQIPLFGHLGEGVFHPRFRDNEEQLISEMYRYVKSLGGKVSGEHGIGLSKKKYLSEDEKIKLCELKLRYDRENILNRDKMISATYYDEYKKTH